MPASDTSSTDEVRILNSISDGKNATRSIAGGKAGKPRRLLVIVLVLLLVAGLATLAALRINRPDSAPVQATGANAPVPPVASAAPAPTPAAEATTTPAAPAAQESSGAGDTAVINDTAPRAPDDAASTASRGPDQLTSALEEGVKPPPATLKNALEAKPEKPAKQAAPHEDKKKKAAKTDKRDDSDVDLIKALVERSGEVERKRTPRDTAGNGNGQKPAQNQATSPRQNEARNVDVVERKNGESTASLLKRCHALGFMEGEFCRWRICSGRWDSDPACKVNDAN